MQAIMRPRMLAVLPNFFFVAAGTRFSWEITNACHSRRCATVRVTPSLHLWEHSQEENNENVNQEMSNAQETRSTQWKGYV